MRAARAFLPALISIITTMQSVAVEADPDASCPPQLSTGSDRQRPGADAPPRLQQAQCDPTRLPTPTASPLPGAIPVDRWRIIDTLGHPDNRLDPYNTNNPLKGDRPLWGADGFGVLTASMTSLFESRRVPDQAAAAIGLANAQRELFNSQTASLDAVVYEGDTIFRPPDYELRLTPIFNFSTTSGGSSTSGRAARTTSNSVGAQALFFEKHLRDVSAQYDFDSVRIGIQPVTSDFRGFVLADQPVGIRFFGTRDNAIYQYSVGWFRRLPKNAARQNELTAGIPANDLLMANLYIQDTGRPGLTSELVFIYDHSRARGTRIVIGDTQTTFIAGARHDYDVAYLGYSADGHVGGLNLTGSVYEVLGRESEGVFTARPETVRASFAALELSRDFDWIRVRASALFASGDDNPADGLSGGFDGINQSAIFAGSDSTFFIHQRLPLVPDAIDLKQRDSLFPSLRPALDSGESNFTNPGLELFGVGSDLDITPALRVSADVSRVAFANPASIAAVLGRNDIPRDIGTDASIDAIYRPFISQNLIGRLSVAKLFATPAARALLGSGAPVSMVLTLVLTY